MRRRDRRRRFSGVRVGRGHLFQTPATNTVRGRGSIREHVAAIPRCSLMILRETLSTDETLQPKRSAYSCMSVNSSGRLLTPRTELAAARTVSPIRLKKPGPGFLRDEKSCGRKTQLTLGSRRQFGFLHWTGLGLGRRRRASYLSG